jgi:hypothetical protein
MILHVQSLLSKQRQNHLFDCQSLINEETTLIELLEMFLDDTNRNKLIIKVKRNMGGYDFKTKKMKPDMSYRRRTFDWNTHKFTFKQMSLKQSILKKDDSGVFVGDRTLYDYFMDKLRHYERSGPLGEYRIHKLEITTHEWVMTNG